MILVLIFALLGFWIGRFPGLLLGALVGFLASRVLRAGVVAALRAVQTQFLDSTFAVMGAVCKADGVVTRDEIRMAEELFSKLNLSSEARTQAKAAFQRGKAADFDLDAEVQKFARTVKGNRTLFQPFLQVQLMAVAADGEIHPAEHEILVRIAHGLGLDERAIAQIEALLRAAAQGVAGSADGPPPQRRIDDAYAALGVSPQSSDDEVKRAYRKLIAENHPDRLASKGMPESMKELAEQRARDINAAYDVLKKSRGMS